MLVVARTEVEPPLSSPHARDIFEVDIYLAAGLPKDAKDERPHLRELAQEPLERAVAALGVVVLVVEVLARRGILAGHVCRPQVHADRGAAAPVAMEVVVVVALAAVGGAVDGLHLKEMIPRRPRLLLTNADDRIGHKCPAADRTRAVAVVVAVVQRRARRHPRGEGLREQRPRLLLHACPRVAPSLVHQNLLHGVVVKLPPVVALHLRAGEGVAVSVDGAGVLGTPRRRRPQRLPDMRAARWARNPEIASRHLPPLRLGHRRSPTRRRRDPGGGVGVEGHPAVTLWVHPGASRQGRREAVPAGSLQHRRERVLHVGLLVPQAIPGEGLLGALVQSGVLHRLVPHRGLHGCPGLLERLPHRGAAAHERPPAALRPHVANAGTKGGHLEGAPGARTSWRRVAVQEAREGPVGRPPERRRGDILQGAEAKATERHGEPDALAHDRGLPVEPVVVERPTPKGHRGLLEQLPVQLAARLQRVLRAVVLQPVVELVRSGHPRDSPQQLLVVRAEQRDKSVRGAGDPFRVSSELASYVGVTAEGHAPDSDPVGVRLPRAAGRGLTAEGVHATVRLELVGVVRVDVARALGRLNLQMQAAMYSFGEVVDDAEDLGGRPNDHHVVGPSPRDTAVRAQLLVQPLEVLLQGNRKAQHPLHRALLHALSRGKGQLPEARLGAAQVERRLLLQHAVEEARELAHTPRGVAQEGVHQGVPVHLVEGVAEVERDHAEVLAGVKKLPYAED
mmetsp:Transcript_10293/g.34976  ORF Transcript_10293/g.34976 Transcript_10293/m.34976 type:complete len:736 (+) Transcript_10293:3431-5638(+)